MKNRPALGDSKSNIGKNLMTLATTYDQEWLQTYQTADGEYSNWNGMASLSFMEIKTCKSQFNY